MKRISSRSIEEIKPLRQKGHSVTEISKITGVSKTSVLRYMRNIEILPEFKTEWLGKRGGSKKRKLLKDKLALVEAEKFVGKLNQKEKVLFLCALYWAEGNKKDLILTNTDPYLIKVFVEILKETFEIKSDQIQVSLRIYEDLDKAKCLKFWSRVVNIPVEDFVNVYILKGKKIGKLEYGMCRIRVIKGGDLLKIITSINKVVAESFLPS